MIIDVDVQNNYYNVFSGFFCSICAIFLIILIRPLYYFSKERKALLILFSKSCANIIYQIRQIYVCIYRYFSFSSSYWSYFFLAPSAGVLLNAAYFHIIVLAINRFHAVFFPLSYQKYWKLKNIKYFICLTWLVVIIWSAVQYVAFRLDIANTGILGILINKILMDRDQALLLAICISAPLYLSILAKFIYDYKYKKVGVDVQLQKDRILILIVFTSSLIPCPVQIAIYQASLYVNTNMKNTLTAMIFNILYNLGYTLIQFIEEICLLFASKEFKKLVLKQFFKNNNQTSVVKTIIVKPYEQQDKNNKNKNGNLVAVN
uniref:Uncharacterized protein n=1 Tax=Meloidogyne enterolobii TaxID=390850 RepID=A0A6V7TR26_MELEN|nr:unnamed protein product [Meloidogyne enterolobii]